MTEKEIILMAAENISLKMELEDYRAKVAALQQELLYERQSVWCLTSNIMETRAHNTVLQNELNKAKKFIDNELEAHT